MTDLSQQTEQLVKALTQLHDDLGALHLTMMIAGGVIALLLLIIVFKKRG